MEELTRKVQALEHQISLLTMGALRNAQSAEPGTFEDICGRGVRTCMDRRTGKEFLPSGHCL